jgi:Tripartite tricarboxylate transporter family receptor
MGLDDAGIDRILKNVGDVPGTLDKSELREDILAAWDFYQGYKREDSKGARTERRDHATKIAHKTSELIRSMASAGTGTPSHVSGELFKMMASVDMVHVPYRSAGPAITDLLGGQVQVMFPTTISSIGYIRADRLRALAVTDGPVRIIPDCQAGRARRYRRRGPQRYILPIRSVSAPAARAVPCRSNPIGPRRHTVGSAADSVLP